MVKLNINFLEKLFKFGSYSLLLKNLISFQEKNDYESLFIILVFFILSYRLTSGKTELSIILSLFISIKVFDCYPDSIYIKEGLATIGTDSLDVVLPSGVSSSDVVTANPVAGLEVEVKHCPECNKCPDRDCVGSWKEWSKCTEGCQGKVSTRKFNIETSARGEGKKCEAQDGETETKECDCIVNVTGKLLPNKIYGYWYRTWDSKNKKVKWKFNYSRNVPEYGRYAKWGTTKAWNKLHTHTFNENEPVTVDKIKLEAKFNDQGWGHFGYGSVFAVGLKDNKRIWVVGLYKPNTRNGKKWYHKWKDKWTYVEKDINLNSHKFNYVERKLINCESTKWPRGKMPSENCQVNDSNSKLIDRIEIWHFNRYGWGHYGYVKDVKITTQPVKPLCSTYTCKENKSSGQRCKQCLCGEKFITGSKLKDSTVPLTTKSKSATIELDKAKTSIALNTSKSGMGKDDLISSTAAAVSGRKAGKLKAVTVELGKGKDATITATKSKSLTIKSDTGKSKAKLSVSESDTKANDMFIGAKIKR